MKEVFMDAGIITAIVLAFVGIAKLPFKGFKEKHPNFFKFTFYFLSLVLAAVLPILAELYVVGGSLSSVEFLLLEVATIAGVFAGYSSYECTSLKKGINILFGNIKKASTKYSDSKLAKVVNKAEKATDDPVVKAKLEEIANFLDAKLQAKKEPEEKVENNNQQ